MVDGSEHSANDGHHKTAKDCATNEGKSGKANGHDKETPGQLRSVAKIANFFGRMRSDWRKLI